MPNKFFGIWSSYLTPTGKPPESDGVFAAFDYGYPNRMMILHTDTPNQPFDADTKDAAESSTVDRAAIHMTRYTSDGKYIIEYWGRLTKPSNPTKIASIAGNFKRMSRGTRDGDSGEWTSNMPPPLE
jgi:hypothetical protein